MAAKAAQAQNNISCMVLENMEDDNCDRRIVDFLYRFVDEFRSIGAIYHSAALIFEGPTHLNEEEFDALLWKRLQSISNLDAANYGYDQRVSCDPQSPHFSFSLKEEALFIVAMHPQSSRPARRFVHPVLVFNPHQQFETLRKTNHFETMKEVVRKRDKEFSGSVNPMLEDFGTASEVLQYSGRVYNEKWKCPLHINHGRSEDNTTP